MSKGYGMTIDLGRYLQLYFEENEAYLRILDQQLVDAQTNLLPANEGMRVAIRAAHSIKGSSGAFGFDEVVKLAQVLELVLRQVERQGIWMGADQLALCRETVVVLRQLLVLRRQGRAADTAEVEILSGHLAECLAEAPVTGV
jgi:two-component system, chemotaxis family, sensor kinase CheA